jgi:hypothetical protein
MLHASGTRQSKISEKPPAKTTQRGGLTSRPFTVSSSDTAAEIRGKRQDVPLELAAKTHRDPAAARQINVRSGAPWQTSSRRTVHDAQLGPFANDPAEGVIFAVKKSGIIGYVIARRRA